MEIPVHDVVNTGTELLREGLPGKQGFITVSLSREAANQPWGFRLQGGKDRGLPFQLLKVTISRQTRTEASDSLSVIRFRLTASRVTPAASLAITLSRSMERTCLTWVTRRPRTWSGRRGTSWLWWWSAGRWLCPAWTPHSPSPRPRTRQTTNPSPTPRW